MDQKRQLDSQKDDYNFLLNKVVALRIQNKKLTEKLNCKTIDKNKKFYNY